MVVRRTSGSKKLILALIPLHLTKTTGVVETLWTTKQFPVSDLYKIYTIYNWMNNIHKDMLVWLLHYAFNVRCTIRLNSKYILNWMEYYLILVCHIWQFLDKHDMHNALSAFIIMFCLHCVCDKDECMCNGWNPWTQKNVDLL